MFKYKDVNIADKCYVINLKSRTDRRDLVSNELDKNHFSGYEFFEGIKMDDPSKRLWGCTMSFIKIFEKALEENLDSIVIFEDDIKLLDGLTEKDLDNVFNSWLYAKENFEIVALGTRPIPNSFIIKEHNHFGSVSNCLCAHAFYYTKNFMEYAYDCLKNFEVEGDNYHKCLIDEFIHDCCSHIEVRKNKNKLFKVGITIPMIFSQRKSFSDNENSEQNYDGWIQYCYEMALKKGTDESNGFQVS
jgi:GR25 family glycosyltransferase involved in LPS biosynthesis